MALMACCSTATASSVPSLGSSVPRRKLRETENPTTTGQMTRSRRRRRKLRQARRQKAVVVDRLDPEAETRRGQILRGKRAGEADVLVELGQRVALDLVAPHGLD